MEARSRRGPGDEEGPEKQPPPGPNLISKPPSKKGLHLKTDSYIPLTFERSARYRTTKFSVWWMASLKAVKIFMASSSP